MSGEFEQHRCEPANDNAHASALAGQDGHQRAPLAQDAARRSRRNEVVAEATRRPGNSHYNDTLVVSFLFVARRWGIESASGTNRNSGREFLAEPFF